MDKALTWIMWVLIIALVAFLVLAFGAVTHAEAHTQWADGSGIPDEIKKACCGEAEAHMLRDEDVWVENGEYHVRGYRYTYPVNKAQPSPDGRFWIFYGTYWGDYGSREKYDGMPICYFAPTGA